MQVFVAGGTGFVGSSLCRVLHDRGHQVTAGARSPEEATLPDGVDTVQVDVTDRASLAAVAGHDAIVNLVALPSHVTPRSQTHRAVQVEGTRNLLDAGAEFGVERFVLLSGLGVDSGVDTAYFRAKRAAERLVRNADLSWVIYRPSVVFGDGCAFLPFLRSVTPPLIAPLPGGGTLRLQPIWVEDLAPMIADGVERDDVQGRIFELGGPDQVSLADIVRLVAGPVRVVPIPMALAAAGAAVAEYLPYVPIGRDQVRVFALDNVVDDNDVAAFGVAESQLRSLETYLKSQG